MSSIGVLFDYRLNKIRLRNHFFNAVRMKQFSETACNPKKQARKSVVLRVLVCCFATVRKYQLFELVIMRLLIFTRIAFLNL